MKSFSAANTILNESNTLAINTLIPDTISAIHNTNNLITSATATSNAATTLLSQVKLPKCLRK